MQEVYTTSKKGIYNWSSNCILSCISLFFLLQQILLEEVSMTAPCPALRKPEYLARTANRFRQSKRPKRSDKYWVWTRTWRFARELSAGWCGDQHKKASDLCYWRAVGDPGPRLHMVHQQHLQAHQAPLQAVADHECLHTPGWLYRAGPLDLHVDVKPEKEGL